MERGGGERQEFGGPGEPRATEGEFKTPGEATEFVPIGERGIEVPVPAPETSAGSVEPVVAEQHPQVADLTTDAIRREVPADKLDEFEDRILAGMEE